MKRGGFILVFIVLLTGVISASFSLSDYSVTSEYGPGETLIGWVEINFDEEPSNSLFEYSAGDESGTATLMELLNADTNFIYSCNPVSCSSSYSGETGRTSKTLNLAEGESTIVGLKITGNNIESISDFSVLISSNAGESEISQLSIDVLNNGEDIWKASTPTGEFTDAVWGCYASSEARATIVVVPYCEKISLSDSPNVRIGAKFIGSGDATFIMTIENTEGGTEGSCEITLTSGGEAGCIVSDFVIEEGDYHVCVQAKTSGEDEYEINSETNSPCGYMGNFNGYVRDFEIFAESGTYGAIGEFTLNEEEIDNINNKILDYIESVYENDCSEGCIIPIKITANAAQTVVLSDALLKYSDGGAYLSSTLLYNLTESPYTISADLQNLSISGGEFEVPEDYGNYTAVLEFEGETIFSEDIAVIKVPTILSVYPLTTAATYPTEFTATIDSEKNISSYEWNFGDNTSKTTTVNNLTHTYSSIGTYNLQIEVTDIDNKSSTKNFTITVDSASVVVESLLEKKQTSLETINTQLAEFSSFEKGILESLLGLDSIGTALDSAETAKTNAATEEDYQTILQVLLEIEVPQSISLSTPADSILFFPDTGNIDIEAVAGITGEDYETSKKSKYADAILSWQVANVDITLTQQEVTASFESYDAPLVNFFEVDITKKEDYEGNSYIILEGLDNLTFASDYGEEQISGYYYTEFTGESKSMIFSTTESVDFETLPLFVSPAISELSLSGTIGTSDDSENMKKWILFALIISLLIIIGITFWIILNVWYRKKYENYLFKNKNNLYNLFTWIENAKKRGLSESKIRTQLRKAGWSSEQSRYALRKYAGKRIGMPGPSLRKRLKKIESKTKR